MAGEADGISVELVSLQAKRRKFDAAWLGRTNSPPAR